MISNEKKISGETIYTGRIINVYKDSVELDNGKIHFREVVRHPGAVCMVAVDEAGKILLVQQFRYPADCVLTEIPAGKLEPGEEPESAARRELQEETGYTAARMIDLGSFYTSPGFCDERLYLYLALDLKAGTAHPDEDEFLNLVRMSPDELVRQIMDGRIRDGKTILGVFKALEYLKREQA